MQTFNKALNNMPIITREQYVVIAYDQLHFFSSFDQRLTLQNIWTAYKMSIHLDQIVLTKY